MNTVGRRSWLRRLERARENTGRAALGVTFGHGWWLAALLTLALILWPVSVVRRLDMLAYDALAGDLMGSDTFDHWRKAWSRDDSSRPLSANTANLGNVPLWAGPADYQTAAAPGGAVIVAIDDASLQAFGPWPWPRSRHAHLIEVLQEAGVSSIAYDVQFSEAASAGSDTEDAALIKTIASKRNVVLPVYARQNTGGADGPTLQGPLPALRRSAAALGHATLSIDDDGTNRRALLDLQIDGRLIPALPLAMWTLNEPTSDPSLSLAALRKPAGTSAPHASGTDVDVLINKDRNIRVFRGREALVPAGAPRVVQISAAQVMMDPQVLPDLRNRAVWVGVTATGLTEPLSTPAARPETQWSRIRWQAQVYEGLRNSTLVQPLDHALIATAMLPPMLLMALMAGRRANSTRGRWGIALVALPLLSTTLLLLFARAWLPPAAATIGWGLGYMLWRGRHLHQQRAALERWQQRADATLHAIADAVITVDKDGRIEYVNPVATRWLQIQMRHLRGRHLEHISSIREEARAKFLSVVADCLHTREISQLAQPVRMLTSEGVRLISATATPVIAHHDARDQGDASVALGMPVAGAVLILSDVTEQVQSAQRLHHEATHDALTGLYNRAGLSERLQAALNNRLLVRERVGVMFIDLDRFKRINDSLGHHHGDAVLRTIAQRLAGACNPDDTVARWGGDEFVILTPDCEQLGERAQRVVDIVSLDIQVDSIDVQCGCSIGVAMAPEDGTTLETLLAQADNAMYASKARGGRRFAFTSKEGHAWTRDSLRLETRLRRALADNTLALHYQPQVQMNNGEPVGMEALLRWHQPDGTVWAPQRFLGIAESSDVILPLGEWVIQQAVRQIAQWVQMKVPVVPVSVNVSARQCLDLHLVDLMAKALSDHKVPAHLVKVEVTETTAMSDVTHVSHLLHDLRDLGVAVAVDDFGTGYSSLAHLRRLPVDQLKIDQSFVRDISSDRYGAAVVRTMIGLAHELGVPVVAEGVESEAQMNFLTLHQCDIAQGYFFARPLEGVEAAKYLHLHHLDQHHDYTQRKLALH